ncbi:MAG: allophanate hydrolase [Alphaproteobacteria bacterium]
MTLPAVPSIADVHAAYRAGIPAEAVIEEVYSRIVQADDPGIFISVLPVERALDYAAALGPFDPVAKPLWGVPFAIKDNIDLADLPTTAACPAFAYRPVSHATAVARLIAAGAIPIGKTNLDQFATGLVGTRTPYPIPRNAVDPAVVPGGSSSGSAVAVARGIVCFALGTDTAGSGRVPAALNGIVGLKPSLGSVSTRGVVPACRTLDCVSVFASTVDDAWTAYAAMAAFDAEDPYSRHRPAIAWSGLPPALRIGVPRPEDLEFCGDNLAEAAFHTHVERMAASARIVPVDMTAFYATARLLYEGPWVGERRAAIGSFMDTHSGSMHPVTRQIVGGADGKTAAETFAGLYRLAELARSTVATWTEIDALCLPSLPRPFTLAEVLADPIRPNSLLGTYTNFVNLLDLCALAVPGHPRADAFPAGVTFVAPAGRDGLLAAIGRLFVEGARGPHAAPPGTVPLAVVGAHMSGLPLNVTLIENGGTFLRETQTASDYRLYALPGGPPARPGLLRVGPDRGASIAAEIWAMPPDGLGRLMATIPSPLSIGSIQLADGQSVLGFLVEAAGTNGADDITAFGGWRAYIGAASAAAPVGAKSIV